MISSFQKLWYGLAAVVLACLSAAPLSSQELLTVTGRVEVAVVGKATRGVDNRNAVVWLTPLDNSGTAFRDNPDSHLRLVQRGKAFEPHLLVVPVGAEVEFPNHDPFFHNVFSLFEGKRFDLGLYEAGGSRLVRIDRLGISYIFCNIHPEMSAVVIALSTPYYAVSNRSGQFSISEVPPGRYMLQIWDEAAIPESLKSGSRQVTLSAAAPSLGVIHLTAAALVRPSHKDKYGRDYDAAKPGNPIYH